MSDTPPPPSSTLNATSPLLTPAPGVLIDERYRLIESIGEGGMGAVWLAEQIKMKRQVVVKVLKPELCHHQDQLDRFKREAELASQLSHPNSVVTHDFGVYQGVSYIVMERLVGEPLSHLMYRRQRLPIPEMVELLTQVCRSLQEAHDKGMVHRDLKPENIFVLSEKERVGFVKVLDFGIAKLIDSHPEASSSNLTRGDMIFGTPQYMAPEQIRGKPLDARADIYALGVIFYQAVVGRLPYEGAVVVDILTQHLTQPVPQLEPTELPALSGDTFEAFNALIAKTMAKQPTDRLSDVATLIAELNALNALAIRNVNTQESSSLEGKENDPSTQETPHHHLEERVEGQVHSDRPEPTATPNRPSQQKTFPVFKLLFLVIIASAVWVYVKKPELAPGDQGWNAWGRAQWLTEIKPRVERFKARLKSKQAPHEEPKPVEEPTQTAPQASSTWRLIVSTKSEAPVAVIIKGVDEQGAQASHSRHQLTQNTPLMLPKLNPKHSYQVACVVQGEKPTGRRFKEGQEGDVEMSCF